MPVAALTLLALAGLGLTASTGGLARLELGQPDGISLPDGAAVDDLAKAPERDLTDAAGNPRCHTDTYAFDCVTEAVTLDLGGQVGPVGPGAWSRHPAGATPEGGSDPIVMVGSGLGMAAIDVAEAGVAWRLEAEVNLGHWQTSAGDLVVARDGADLVALERATGEIRWRRDDMDGAFGNAWITAGSDTPVYLRTEDVDSARLLALRRGDGRTLWEARLGDDAHPTPGPDGTVLIRRHGAATARPDLYVLDAHEGTRLWSIDHVGPSWVDGDLLVLTTEEGTRAVAARSGDVRWELDDIAVMPGTVDVLLAMEQDTGRALRLDAASGERLWAARLAGLEATEPLSTWTQVANDVAYVVEQGRGATAALTAIDVETGEHRWSRRFASDAGSPSFTGSIEADDELLIAALRERPGGPALLAVELDSGRTRWTVPVDDPQLFGIRQNGQLAFVPSDGALEARDLATGELQWRVEHEQLQPLSVDPLLVVADDTLYRIDPTRPDG